MSLLPINDGSEPEYDPDLYALWEAGEISADELPEGLRKQIYGESVGTHIAKLGGSARIAGRSRSLLWPRVYDALRREGMSKEKAARISNAHWNKYRRWGRAGAPGPRSKAEHDAMKKAADGLEGWTEDWDAFLTDEQIAEILKLILAEEGEIAKYNKDQPRDDRGRWTSSGATSGGLQDPRLPAPSPPERWVWSCVAAAARSEVFDLPVVEFDYDGRPAPGSKMSTARDASFELDDIPRDPTEQQIYDNTYGAVQRWVGYDQSGAGQLSPYIRSLAVEMTTGERNAASAEVYETGNEVVLGNMARRLMGVVRQAEPFEKPLYRGVILDRSTLDKIKVGDEVVEPLGSSSLNQGVSASVAKSRLDDVDNWSIMGIGQGASEPVMFRMNGAKGIFLTGFNEPEPFKWAAQEVLVSGRFRVTGITKQDVPVSTFAYREKMSGVEGAWNQKKGSLAFTVIDMDFVDDAWEDSMKKSQPHVVLDDPGALFYGFTKGEITKYDPRQPRDDRGRWTSSGRMTPDDIARTARENPDGFTVSMKDGSAPSGGYVVAKPNAESLVLDADDIDMGKIRDWAERHQGESHLGGWLDTDAGKYVLDPVEVIDDRDAAIAAGRERNQKAIFDLNTFEEIDTGGTGGYS